MNGRVSRNASPDVAGRTAPRPRVSLVRARGPLSHASSAQRHGRCPLARNQHDEIALCQLCAQVATTPAPGDRPHPSAGRGRSTRKGPHRPGTPTTRTSSAKPNSRLSGAPCFQLLGPAGFAQHVKRAMKAGPHGSHCLSMHLRRRNKVSLIGANDPRPRSALAPCVPRRSDRQHLPRPGTWAQSTPRPNRNIAVRIRPAATGSRAQTGRRAPSRRVGLAIFLARGLCPSNRPQRVERSPLRG